MYIYLMYIRTLDTPLRLGTGIGVFGTGIGNTGSWELELEYLGTGIRNSSSWKLELESLVTGNWYWSIWELKTELEILVSEIGHNGYWNGKLRTEVRNTGS